MSPAGAGCAGRCDQVCSAGEAAEASILSSSIRRRTSVPLLGHQDQSLRVARVTGSGIQVLRAGSSTPEADIHRIKVSKDGSLFCLYHRKSLAEEVTLLPSDSSPVSHLAAIVGCHSSRTAASYLKQSTGMLASVSANASAAASADGRDSRGALSDWRLYPEAVACGQMLVYCLCTRLLRLVEADR